MSFYQELEEGGSHRVMFYRASPSMAPVSLELSKKEDLYLNSKGMFSPGRLSFSSATKDRARVWYHGPHKEVSNAIHELNAGGFHEDSAPA